MTSREQTLAIVFLGLLLVGGGGFCGYLFVLAPLQEKNAAAQKLQGEVGDLELKALKMKKEMPQIKAVKRQSLPPDEDVAKAQYKLLLERLLLQTNLIHYKLSEGQLSASSPLDARTRSQEARLQDSVILPRPDQCHHLAACRLPVRLLPDRLAPPDHRHQNHAR